MHLPAQPGEINCAATCPPPRIAQQRSICTRKSRIETALLTARHDVQNDASMWNVRNQAQNDV